MVSPEIVGESLDPQIGCREFARKLVTVDSSLSTSQRVSSRETVFIR